MNERTKFPATKVAHWVTGPISCCDKHAAKIVGLGNFMGMHVTLTDAPDSDECTNCRNEAAKVGSHE